MSTEIEKDILCPQCGQSQKYRLYASINAKENPELKRRVLSETLFDWRCKRCNYFAAMAYSFLYTDPEAGYIVCVAPGGEGRTAQPTQEIQSYTKRVVKNLAELKEKILIFDLGYDDVAVELVKNALCTIIARTYQVNRVHAYFSRINEGEMEFAVFLPRKQDPCTTPPSWKCTASPRRCCAPWTLWTPQALPGWIPSWPASCCRIIRISDTQREGALAASLFCCPFFWERDSFTKRLAKAPVFFWLCENPVAFSRPFPAPRPVGGKKQVPVHKKSLDKRRKKSIMSMRRFASNAGNCRRPRCRWAG